MSYKNKAKQISDMWAEIAENEGAYFEFFGTMGWEKQNKAPNIDSLLDRWRVNNPQKKWCPTLSNYTVTSELSVSGRLNVNSAVILTRVTKKEAKQLAKDIISLATLTARVDELDGRKEFNKDKANFCIYLATDTDTYQVTHNVCNKPLTAIYMTEQCAKQICGELNSGYLELLV